MHAFDTTTPVTVDLEIPGGSIHLVASDRADLTVDVVPTGSSKADRKAAEQATVAFADGVLRIRAGENAVPLLGPSGSVDVTVELPTGSSLTGRAAGAGLRTTGSLGEITFEGAYGTTVIEAATRVGLTALDGDIEVQELRGDSEISTQRGNLRIAQAHAGKVVLSTMSGDISIAAAPGVSAVLDAGTALGRLTNTLRNDGAPALDIRATTGHGSIDARSL